ncbi:MAG: acyltransferase family protein [Porphyromonas sp.]
MNQRSSEFDILKGIGISLVIIGHVCYYLMKGGGGWANWHRIIDSFHMPLFFFVSGYFSSKGLSRITNIETGAKWVYSKILRLILPLCFIPVIYVTLINNGYCSFNLIVGGEYWFTYSLFISFIALFLSFIINQSILSCLKSVQREGLTILRVLLYLASIIAVKVIIEKTQTFDPSLYKSLRFDKLLELYPYMLIAFLLGEQPKLDKYLKHEITITISLLSFVGLMFVKFHSEGFPYSWLATGLAAIIFLYGAVSRPREIGSVEDKVMNCLAYLGKISLPIYFMHNFFRPNLAIFYNYYLSLEDTPVWSFAFLFIFSLIVASLTLFATLIGVWVTRRSKYLCFLLYGEQLPR